MAHCGVVNEGMSCHHNEAFPDRAPGQLIHFTGLRGQRLFDEDVLTGVQNPFCQIKMSGGRRGDNNGGDFRIVQSDVNRVDRLSAREIHIHKSTPFRTGIDNIANLAS